jgi:hypothetical protein
MFGFLVATSAEGADKPQVAEKMDKSDNFVFQLLPNSLSRNPRLDMSVITEMTVLGKKLRPPSPEQPYYFVAQSGGYKKLGMAAPANEKSPLPEELEKMMFGALAKSGFLPGDKTHPATLVIIYHWGSYTSTKPETDADMPEVPEVLLRKELLERAAVVGGLKFSAELAQALEEEDNYSQSTAARVDPTGNVSTIPSVAGDLAANFTNTFNPMQRFINRDDATRRLCEMALGSCYFVIASAYDAGAIAQGKKLLLWRTKMSVLANGVALKETIRPMITHAGNYFGRDMSGPVTLSRRVSDGKVQIGEASVIGVEESKGGATRK